MDLLKAIIRWIIVGLVLAAVSCVVLILTRPPLRETAVHQIAELTGTKVRAGLVDFNLDGSVLIKNLEISPREKKPYDNTILKAESVHAQFGIGGLFSFRPRLKEISVRDFVFSLRHDLDTGEWNLAAIKTRPSGAGQGPVPVVRLQAGKFQYSKVSDEQVEVVKEVPVEALLRPSEQTSGGYSFDIAVPAETAAAGRSTLSGLWKPGKVTVSGGISSVDVPAFDRAWTAGALNAELEYDPNSNFSLRLNAGDLVGEQTNPADVSSFDEPVSLSKSGPFRSLRTFFDRFRPTGRIDIEVKAWGNLNRLSESRLVGKVTCKDVSVCDRKFPYTMEHMTGPIDFTENSAVVNELSGEHGDVNLTIDGWSSKLGSNWQYEIRLGSDNMLLDTDLYDALSARRKSFWDAYSPSGKVSIDYRLTRKPPADSNSTLMVELLNVDAAYHNFPYPLRNLTGKLVFERDSLKMSQLVSEYDGRRITLDGGVTDRHTDRPIYDISIEANDIPLDSTLTEALPADQKDFYGQFDVTGLADAGIKILTPSQGLGPTTFTAGISFKDASLKVRPLPLAISGISAKAVFAPELINLKELTGRYGDGLVSIAGEISPGDNETASRYCLSLEAEQIELSDDLLTLLPDSLQKFVRDMQPQGRVNFTGNLNSAAAENCADQKIVLQCLGNSAGLRFAKAEHGEGPVNFSPSSYPLSNITGKLTVTNDNITLEDITARPVGDTNETGGTSKIELNGKIALADNAFNTGRFQVKAYDVSFDDRLRSLLPEGIVDSYLSLSPAGRFDLDLINIEVSSDEDANAVERSIDFAGTATFKECGFDILTGVTDLDGLLTAHGRYASDEGFHGGRAVLAADKLKIKKKSLTDLKADIVYDQDKKRWTTECLIADFYGGRMAGEFNLGRSTQGHMDHLLQVGFERVDLRQFLADRNLNSQALNHKPPTNGYTSGEMSGSLSVTSFAREGAQRIGRCRLAISDMQIGKLSPLAQLLYVLKLTEPKDFAFERMVVDSYIRDDRLLIEEFDLAGEALAFHGAGSMDLQTQNVDLVLTVRGDRLAAAEPSIVQSLAEGLGQAVLRMEVSGNIYEPHVEVKTLPLLRDPFDIFGKRH